MEQAEELSTFIGIDTIVEFLEEQDTEDIEPENFEDFVTYLEGDFHNWLSENFHHYVMNKNEV